MECDEFGRLQIVKDVCLGGVWEVGRVSSERLVMLCSSKDKRLIMSFITAIVASAAMNV